MGAYRRRARGALIGAGVVAAAIAAAACNAVLGLDEFDLPSEVADAGPEPAPECETAAFCPRSSDPCTAPVCVAGRCGFYVFENYPSPVQTPGDCLAVICDGAGDPFTVASPEDRPTDYNPCTEDICGESGPEYLPVDPGTPCSIGGKSCECNGLAICDCPHTSGCDQGDASGAHCGDSVSGCLGCALGGHCADELALCQSTQDCVDYVTCVDPCANQACTDQCVADHPTGAALYNDLVSCAICQECPIDCDAAGSGCP